MTDSAYSRIPQGRPATIDGLVDLYGPVVEHYARHYYRDYYDYRRSLEDLRQDAWIGIIKAWYDYDDGRNMSFKVYAVNMARWWLLNNIRYVDAALFNAWRTDKELYQKILQVDSLDRIRDDFGDHFDLPALTKEPNCSLSFKFLLSLIKTEKFRYIVEQYYQCERTLDDIGKEFGVSRERVRQMLNQAYKQIKSGLNKKKRNPFAVTS